MSAPSRIFPRGSGRDGPSAAKEARGVMRACMANFSPGEERGTPYRTPRTRKSRDGGAIRGSGRGCRRGKNQHPRLHSATYYIRRTPPLLSRKRGKKKSPAPWEGAELFSRAILPRGGRAGRLAGHIPAKRMRGRRRSGRHRSPCFQAGRRREVPTSPRRRSSPGRCRR